MSKKILLISESQIKAQSNVENGVDGKVLSKVILNVQETHLKGIIGNQLYSDLLDAVELQIISGTTLSDTYSTLLNDYIHPYLINAVLADFVVLNNFKITNKGVLKMSDNSANNVSPDELEYAKNYFDNYSQSFKNSLIKYLADNSLVECTKANETSGSIGWFLN
jgi:hypothetical protein